MTRCCIRSPRLAPVACPRALSIGYYNSAYIDIVVGVFMILFGANFSLYYLILLGNIRTALRNEELRWFRHHRLRRPHDRS